MGEGLYLQGIYVTEAFNRYVTALVFDNITAVFV